MNLLTLFPFVGDDLTEEDIDDMIADVDTDGSGWVDYDGKCRRNILMMLKRYGIDNMIIFILFAYYSAMLARVSSH